MSNNALTRVIDEVDNLPNLIKVVQGGRVDRVMRVVPLEARVLDLDKGPDKEEWEQIRRLVFLQAGLEKKSLDPVEVGTSKEWTLTADRVPVVDIGIVTGNIVKNKQTLEKEANARSRQQTGKKAPGRPKKSQE